MTLSLAGRPALSTPGARLVCIVSPLRDAAHAETEARIIIAEHEHSALWRKCAWDFTPLRIAGVPESCQIHSAVEAGDPWTALAEALAAFVGEDEVRS